MKKGQIWAGIWGVIRCFDVEESRRQKGDIKDIAPLGRGGVMGTLDKQTKPVKI